MSWRFLIASDVNVERYVIRDIDSRLSRREKSAVDDWMLSEKKFHVMRDHQSHARYAMSGGMWGGIHEAMPNMRSLILNQDRPITFLKDMDFLNSMVWIKAESSVFQHDSFSCVRYEIDNSFPTTRVGFEHVRSVFINNKMRQSDVDVLRKALRRTSTCASHNINQTKNTINDSDSTSTLLHKIRAK